MPRPGNDRARRTVLPGASVAEQLSQALQRELDLRNLLSAQNHKLRESSDLLREVNHRAKNNLQMAMAMLAMQALASEDARVSDALNSASRRLGYLARVHELLYQRADDLQRIELRAFLTDIAVELGNAFNRSNIEVTVDIPGITVEPTQAINLALIAGEAMLNSYKYAFPDGRAGTIQVRFIALDGTGFLTVADDGVGFSTERRRGSLGMRLLRALGRALAGETRVEGVDGTKVNVQFPMNPQRID